MRKLLAGILGVGAGGVLGYFAFFWIARQGLYAPMLPGGLVGLGGRFAGAGQSGAARNDLRVDGARTGLVVASAGNARNIRLQLADRVVLRRNDPVDQVAN